MSILAAAALALTLEQVVNDPVRPLSSAAVVALRDGKVVYSAQAGCKRFEAGRCVPAAAGDLYRIASVSKMVTALGVLRMVERGQLDLDRDIGDYLGYRVRHPAYPDAVLTLRRLLSHTSGLTDQAGYRLPAGSQVASLLNAPGAQWEARHPPGSFFRYANLNYGVIASVMERASGQRFDLLMQALVLQPLALQGGFNPALFSGAERDALATLYRKPAGAAWSAQIDAPSDAPVAVPEAYVPGSNGTLFSPQGGLRISAQGLATIMQVLLDGGAGFLAPASVRELLRVQWRSDGRNGDDAGGLFKAWGLGVQVFEGSGALKGAGHLGDAWGLLSGVAIDPASRSGVAYIIGGMAFDPATWPGSRSPLSGIEEQLLDHAYSRIRP